MCDHLKSEKPKLYRCEHGGYHLVMSSTTLHLTAAQVRDLDRLMKLAREQFDDLKVQDDPQASGGKTKTSHRFRDHLN